ncbi:MAG: hypothetical protein WCS97_02010 [Candidatus Paceibacterota bacterium]|jgi:hypothetical protein
MHSELTNLLPLERQQLLRREYFMRLSVVSLSLIVLLTLSAAVLLVPTYVFLTESARAKEVRLANIGSTISSSDDATLSNQLSLLSKNAATLTTLAETQSISEIVRAVLAISRPGITLSSFAYSSAAGKNLGTLKISGNAMTRDALRNYQLALSGASFARSADLPVSAYAKDSNIAFTIAMTLAP